jgi:hypothetical protein
MTTAIKLLLLGVAAAILVVITIVADSYRPATAPHMLSTSRTESSTPPLPQLALLSSRGGASSSAYYKVEGEVLNFGSTPLRSVLAVATWYDKQDQFITSDNALIEFDPLLPGQKSPFKILMRTNPAMHAYAVTFKTIGGTELAVEDRRKAKRK